MGSCATRPTYEDTQCEVAPRPYAQPAVSAASIKSVAAGMPIATIEAIRSGKLREDFTFQGQGFIAKIVDVYDGDTVRALFATDLELNSIVQYRVRMLGYNSPEMKPRKDSPERLEEKKLAVAARDALIGRILGTVVYMVCDKFDKYGRPLVTLYTLEGENINGWMINSGYGKPYMSPSA